MTDWLLLTATLPTAPSGLRVRVWRALKATGAGSLREGVYLLPAHAATAQALHELGHTIADAGAPAHLLTLQARDAAQEESFRSLFDRTAAHAEFVQAVKAARTALRTASEAEARRQQRALDQRWQALQASDFFPDTRSRKSADALAALRHEVERRLAADEPSATAAAIALRSPADFQSRTWATRKRPWIDRLATAWLIQRFVDRRPRFLWLSDPKRCPRSALGYDFDGATFTHVDDKVTFEVIAQSFSLLGDPALRRLADLVHYLDVGGIPVDEAAGLEAIVRGLQSRHTRDDELLAAALPVFDALHAALQASDAS